MRKSITRAVASLIVAAVFLTSAAVSMADDWPLAAGDFWEVSGIDTKDGGEFKNGVRTLNSQSPKAGSRTQKLSTTCTNARARQISTSFGSARAFRRALKVKSAVRNSRNGKRRRSRIW